MRRTQTSCTTKAESTIEDYWVHPVSVSRELSEEWIGRTCFYLRRTPPKKGYRWESCRETRRQKNSNRSPSIWPEDLPKLGDKFKAHAIVEWNRESANRTECTVAHAITEIVTDTDQTKESNTLFAELLKTYEDRAPPMMPCYTKKEKRKMAVAVAAIMAACIRDSTMSAKKKKTLRTHAEHHAALEVCSEEFQTMIHTAIAPEKVNFIFKAKEAVEKELKKLMDVETFALDEIMDQDDVIKMYADRNKPVHFGSLRALSHEKHSELQLEDPEYKGRVVFRRDIVRDNDGYYTVFSEPGTSSSHMAATKFLDAIARMPDCDGEDSDAMSAYTQVKLDEIGKNRGKGHEFVDTWVSLPKANIPTRFLHMKTPVCALTRNLHGHKLAGVLWLKYAEHIIINELDFEKLMSWECLYFHKEKQLFPFVYVDDLKMPGISANIKPMSELMQAHMKLKPPKKMWENQYLGCAQKPLEPP